MARQDSPALPNGFRGRPSPPFKLHRHSRSELLSLQTTALIVTAGIAVPLITYKYRETTLSTESATEDTTDDDAK